MTAGTRVLDLLDTAPRDEPPRSGADRAQVMIAEVTAVSTDGTQVSVSILGADPVQLPATASVWTGVTTAHVLMDPGTGRPVHVLGPATKPLESASTAPPTQGEDPVTVVRTATVTPEWSGTWTAGQGWDRLNIGRYGGRTDLYQGALAGIPRTGLATYGQRITALAASKITRATLTLTGNGSNRGSWTAIIQCADKTTAGPAPSGTTAGVTITGTATAQVDITALAGGLMAGRGLALVGASYGAVHGTGASMSLALTYEALA
ncbi:MAG: hypothetical protein Q4C85_08665 [Actinomyces sp.]|uniref:hypothetical protein n=1 Tax=Actinomyces sp. TaxID=29317 RepID=UPI0026DB46E2|nr:hypothetical protein [Actinomyces sp.]MDO4243810.1 hypothetical protein [Actinomyces sp.]